MYCLMLCTFCVCKGVCKSFDSSYACKMFIKDFVLISNWFYTYDLISFKCVDKLRPRELR